MENPSPNSSSGQLGFKMSPVMRCISCMLNAAACLSESLASTLALKLFLTPPRHKSPLWEIDLERNAVRKKLKASGLDIAIYEWGKGPGILLVHSWGGRGTHLGKFILPLVQAGYRVIAFDGPAHGRSQGKRTDMVEFSSVIVEVANQIGDVNAIICHSFGAATTLLALREHGINVEKVVSIGCFSSGIWVTETFGRMLRLREGIIAGMRHALESRYGGRLKWENLAPVDMVDRLREKLMIVHDTNDREVPFHHAEELKNSAPYATFFSTENLGHRRILKDRIVIQKISEFITRPLNQTPSTLPRNLHK